MKIKHVIIMVFLVLFLISNVSAAHLDETDLMQVNVNSDSNEDIVTLQDSSSDDIQTDSLDSEGSGVVSMDLDVEDSSSMNSQEVSDDSSDDSDLDNLAVGDLDDVVSEVQPSDNSHLDSSAIGELDDVVSDAQSSDYSAMDDSDEVISDDPDNILNDGENDNPQNGLLIDPTGVSYGLDLDDIINNENPLYAVVDFGSNSIHMEIYELKKSGKIKSVLSISEPSVTASYCEDNKLTSTGKNELISIFEDFIEIMDLAGVKSRYFFATASLRKIDNCEEVIDMVKNSLGVDINLIAGEQEAILSFNSVKDSDLTEDNGILIDLGGGSCEVIDFVDKNPVTMESMPIGAFSMYNDYVSTMFPNETEIESIQNRVLDELAQLEVSNEVARTDLFGVGGSVKAIKKVLKYLNLIDDGAKSVAVSKLNELLDIFKDNTKETYEIILKVESDRVNTFVPGLIITKTICDYFGIETLHFCKNGIREGVAQQLVNQDLAREEPNMEVSDLDVYEDEDIQIRVGLESNATGDIVVEFYNMILYGSNDNGTAVFNIPKLNPGNYTAKVTYGGDDNYRSQKQKINIHVKSVSLDMLHLVRAYNSGLDYSVKLKDDQGNAVVDKLVLFTVGKIQYSARTNANGVAVINPGLKVGTYNVTVSSPLLEGNVTKTLKIVKRIQNNRNLNVYYNSNQKYKIKIIGDDGKAESSGKSVKVIIDNKQYTYKTDKNGFITIALNKNLKPGKHTIKVQYKGSSVSNIVNVKHALSSRKLFTVKKTAKYIILNAKLTLNNKKLVKGKVIGFTFKGKTYRAKTNANGVARITLKRSGFKKGNYSLKIVYLKDIIKANVKIL